MFDYYPFPPVCGELKSFSYSPNPPYTLSFRFVGGLTLDARGISRDVWNDFKEYLVPGTTLPAAEMHEFIAEYCLDDMLREALSPCPRCSTAQSRFVVLGVERLMDWLPPPTHHWVQDLVLNRLPCVIICVQARKSKHGDHLPNAFDALSKVTISICGNPYQQFLTTIHELAHNEVHLRWSRRRLDPHGQEWQLAFQRLLVEALDLNLFPDKLRGAINEYARNPKASSSRDTKLQAALRAYDTADHRPTVEELPDQTWFSLDGKLIFRKGKKLRTYYSCETKDGRGFRVHATARVSIIYDQPGNRSTL